MFETLILDDLQALAHDSLARAGVPEAAAMAVARDVALAEALGDRASGLEGLLRDLRLIRYGHILPSAPPTLHKEAETVLCIDAGHGLAAAALADSHAQMRDPVRRAGTALIRLDRASAPTGLRQALIALADDGVATTLLTADGTRRASHPDAPQPCILGGVATPATSDDPLAGPVTHRAWLCLTDIATSGAMPPLAVPPDTPPVPLSEVAVPTDLLAQIIAS